MPVDNDVAAQGHLKKQNHTEAIWRIWGEIATDGTALDLGDLALCELPAELGMATSLQHLALGKSALRQTPDGVEFSYAHMREEPTLTSLARLASLHALRTIDMTGCKSVSDLSPLAGLTALTELRLPECGSVSDLSPLAGLTALTELDLSACGSVSDLSPLAGLTALTELNLSACGSVSDLSPLAGLIALTQLELFWSASVSDLFPLASLTRLTKLTLPGGYRSVSDLNPLAGLTRLTSLVLRVYRPNLGAIVRLSKSGQVGLDQFGCKAGSDLSPLAGLTGLTDLRLSGCEAVWDLSPLAGLTGMTKLSLSGCESVSDLSPLAGLTGLTQLNLPESESVSDLSPLAGLTGLTELYLANCTSVSDLSPLAGLTLLTSLNLSGCESVSDLSPLAGLIGLTNLYLSNCSSVSDLSPLLTLKNLKNLHVDGCQISLPDHLRDYRPAPEILAWWQAERAAEVIGRRRMLEVKLLIVGQGRVGKSHLRERVFGDAGLEYYDAGLKATENFDPVEITESITDPDDPSREAAVAVRGWDFGGQPELHSAHRFFLGAQRCFYLLVLAADRPANGDGPDSNRLNYWLRLIAHYGTRPPTAGNRTPPRAPVLIVVTRCDRSTADEAAAIRQAIEDARQAKFFGAYVVAVVEGFGWSPSATPTVWERHEAAAAEIHNAVRRNLAAVPDLWEQVIEEYHIGRQFVANAFANGIDGRPMARAYLTGDTLDRFTSLFRGRAGTTNETELVAFRNVCLGMLQHLGAVHWVAELLPVAEDPRPGGVRDTAFNPEWVKGPVYDLLGLDQSDCPRPGVVPTSRIEEVLAPHPAYTKGKDLYRQLPFTAADRRRVLDLMRECKLAFDTVGRDGLLIPDLMEPVHLIDPPAGSWRYSCPFLPEKVFLRFVGERYHRWDKTPDHCRRNRVVGEIAGHRVAVEAHYSPSGQTRPYLVLLSASDTPVPESVALSFRDDIDRVFIAEGFDPTNYQLVLVGESSAVGVDRYQFLCRVRQPAGGLVMAEYTFHIVFDGRDLAADPAGGPRHQWKSQTGLHQLWLLLRNVGTPVPAALLTNKDIPPSGRFARPDPIAADNNPDPTPANRLARLRLQLSRAEDELEKAKANFRIGEGPRELVEFAQQIRDTLQLQITDITDSTFRTSIGAVRESIKAAVKEIDARMKAWNLPQEAMTHFDHCKSTKTTKKAPGCFIYRGGPFEWRTQ